MNHVIVVGGRGRVGASTTVPVPRGLLFGNRLAGEQFCCQSAKSFRINACPFAFASLRALRSTRLDSLRCKSLHELVCFVALTRLLLAPFNYLLISGESKAKIRKFLRSAQANWPSIKSPDSLAQSVVYTFTRVNPLFCWCYELSARGSVGLLVLTRVTSRHNSAHCAHLL